jgi:hypothetical protein
LKVRLGIIASRFSYKVFFASFLVVLVAQIIDASISSMVDILKDFSVSFWGVLLFIGISIVYGVGQYLILGIVKAKNKEKEISRTHFNALEKIVTIIQYLLIGLLVLVILQIILNSGYSTIMLRIATIISCGLAILIMRLLSYSLFSWFRTNKALVVLLYGLAAAAIAIYLVAVTIIFEIALQEKPIIVNPQTYTNFDISGPIVNSMDSLQIFCSIISFILIWGGNILLLRQNVHRIGKAKFWMLMSTPLIAWSFFFLFFYQSIIFYVGEDPFMGIVVPLLLILASQVAALILIGATFGSVAKALDHAPIIRDYMMITAFGFILFFTATLATISGAGYPPFGLVNVLLLGPFSFLILNGLYRSAICVAEDIKLRQSIKTLAKRESKLLDIAATAEVQQDIQNKVMVAVRANADLLEEQSGVEPTLTDTEIREQLEIVTQELKKYR